MVEVVPDYRFNLRDFKEVETGRGLQLVHHVGKEIAVTVKFLKFAVVLWWYGLRFLVFIHFFHYAECLFSLSCIRRISIIYSSMENWLAVYTSIIF